MFSCCSFAQTCYLSPVVHLYHDRAAHRLTRLASPASACECVAQYIYARLHYISSVRCLSTSYLSTIDVCDFQCNVFLRCILYHHSRMEAWVVARPCTVCPVPCPILSRCPSNNEKPTHLAVPVPMPIPRQVQGSGRAKVDGRGERLYPPPQL